MEKVLLGMSGGVDSTAAAVLLKEQGYEVIGATMLLWRDRGMRAVQEEMARKSADLAARLGIRHLILDLSQAFYQQIVRPFIQSYHSGQTPNPCVLCNRLFKFTLLPSAAEKALEEVYGPGFKADYIASGHYARIWRDPESGEYQLLKAKDRSKDQSYVLWTLKQEDLARLLLPLGELSKEEAREIAAEAGTPIPREEESQDICFISRSYIDLLRENGGFGKPGWFIDEEGKALAPHPGIARFTVGQRKKLGHSFGKRVSISDIDPDSGNILIAGEERLYAEEILLNHLVLNTAEVPDFPLEVEFSARYQQAPKPAVLESYDDPVSGAEYRLLAREAQRAPCPGQSSVFYRGDRLLGGAIIVRQKAADLALKEYPLVLRREAPAKINLNLHIFDIGEDGMHPLRSVMQTVSLSDLVTLSMRPGNKASVRLSVDDPSLPSGPENLAYQAVARWMEESGVSAEVEILLEKNIPVQAGLGGGSSDAAAVLLILQEMAGEHALSARDLNRLALSLGSDVPFFLHGGRALVGGIGEEVRPLPDLPRLAVLLVKPEAACSTGEMFRRLDLARAKGKLPGRSSSDSEDFVNDFRDIATEVHPEIAEILDLLEKSRPLVSSLSGSGSACFALYRDAEEAEAAAALCRAQIPGLSSYLCHTLPTNPALGKSPHEEAR